MSKYYNIPIVKIVLILLLPLSLFLPPKLLRFVVSVDRFSCIFGTYLYDMRIRIRKIARFNIACPVVSTLHRWSLTANGSHGLDLRMRGYSFCYYYPLTPIYHFGIFFFPYNPFLRYGTPRSVFKLCTCQQLL